MNAQTKRALIWIVIGAVIGALLFNDNGPLQGRYVLGAVLGTLVSLCGYLLARLLRV